MSSRYFSKRLKDIAKRKANARGQRARPKTFKTEEAAKKYAESEGIKDYTLENIRISDKNLKIRIVKK